MSIILSISCFRCKKTHTPCLHPKNDHEKHPSLHQHSSHCSKLTLFHYNPDLPINFRSSKKNVPPKFNPWPNRYHPLSPHLPLPNQPTSIAENLQRIWDFRAQRGHHNQHYVIPTSPVPTEPSCKASLSSVRPTAGGTHFRRSFRGKKQHIKGANTMKGWWWKWWRCYCFSLGDLLFSCYAFFLRVSYLIFLCHCRL